MTRSVSPIFSAVCLLSLLSGCSWINAPARPIVDAGQDADVGCPAVESECGDGDDNDCDGWPDCADLDCDAVPTCCLNGQLLVEEDWGQRPTPERWQSSSATLVPSSTGFLSAFGTGLEALMLEQCIPVELGVEITFSMNLSAAFQNCTEGQSCGEEVQLVLTPSTEPLSDVPLPPILSVRLARRENADLEVYVQGELATDDQGVSRVRIAGRGDDIRGRLILYPLFEAGKEVQIAASLELAYGPRDQRTVWVPLDTDVVAERSDLIGLLEGCAAGRGLHLAVQGRGNRFEIGNIQVLQRTCGNPSVLDSMGTIDLPNASWNVGEPAGLCLTNSLESGTSQYRMFFDGSNLARNTELLFPLRYSIGGASSDDPSGLVSWNLRQNGAPILGRSPPQCLAGQGAPEGCPNLNSFREPFALVLTDELGVPEPLVSIPVVFSENTDGTDRYAIGWGTTNSSAAITREQTLLEPQVGALGDCRSLRQPVLVPRGPRLPMTETGFRLYFICEQLAESTVWVVPLTANLTPTGASPRPVLQIGAEELLFDFVVAGEGAVSQRIERMWFLSRDGQGRTSLNYAVANLGGGGDGIFRAYPANPILEDQSGPTCTTCTFSSVGVTRVFGGAAQERRYRLALGLVAGGDIQMFGQLFPEPR